MTDRERITEAAESNGWRPQGLPSMMSFRRNGHVVTVQFSRDGKALVARVQGREVRRSVLAAVLQEMKS